MQDFFAKFCVPEDVEPGMKLLETVVDLFEQCGTLEMGSWALDLMPIRLEHLQKAAAAKFNTDRAEALAPPRNCA